MGINVEQLTELVIAPTLIDLNLYSPAAVQLLLGTIAVESKMGHYLAQIGGGPALGIYQMEPATYHDIWRRFIAFKPQISSKMYTLFGGAITLNASRMIHDLKFATAMARLHYYRVKEALPQDLPGMARYWKQHYNTVHGKGTEDKFISAYHQFVH